VKGKISQRDFLCKLGLIPYRLSSSIIFKELPTEEVKKKLKEDGYKYIELPRNPYIH
jgi:sugar phosphate isomerase/epimerase